jgi:hypothetical protein
MRTVRRRRPTTHRPAGDALGELRAGDVAAADARATFPVPSAVTSEAPGPSCRYAGVDDDIGAVTLECGRQGGFVADIHAVGRRVPALSDQRPPEKP